MQLSDGWNWSDKVTRDACTIVLYISFLLVSVKVFFFKLQKPWAVGTRLRIITSARIVWINYKSCAIRLKLFASLLTNLNFICGAETTPSCVTFEFSLSKRVSSPLFFFYFVADVWVACQVGNSRTSVLQWFSRTLILITLSLDWEMNERLSSEIINFIKFSLSRLINYWNKKRRNLLSWCLG